MAGDELSVKFVKVRMADEMVEVLYTASGDRSIPKYETEDWNPLLKKLN